MDRFGVAVEQVLGELVAQVEERRGAEQREQTDVLGKDNQLAAVGYSAVDAAQNHIQCILGRQLIVQRHLHAGNLDVVGTDKVQRAGQMDVRLLQYPVQFGDAPVGEQQLGGSDIFELHLADASLPVDAQVQLLRKITAKVAAL